MYKTNREKYNAVIEEISKLREAGSFFGTPLEISELLSRALKIRKIPHQFKCQDAPKEAEVVAEPVSLAW